MSLYVKFHVIYKSYINSIKYPKMAKLNYSHSRSGKKEKYIGLFLGL